MKRKYSYQTDTLNVNQTLGRKGLAAGQDQSLPSRSTWLEGRPSVQQDPGSSGWLENVSLCGVKEKCPMTERFVCVQSLKQVLPRNLKTLHALMWDEEDTLGMLHLIVSNFSKKKSVSPVTSCDYLYPLIQ